MANQSSAYAPFANNRKMGISKLIDNYAQFEFNLDHMWRFRKASFRSNPTWD